MKQFIITNYAIGIIVLFGCVIDLFDPATKDKTNAARIGLLSLFFGGLGALTWCLWQLGRLARSK